MPDASRPDEAKRAFFIHAAAWALANAGLAAWNLAQTPAAGQPREYWFVWPLIGWGIGVAAHGLALWLKRLGRSGGGLFAEREVRGAAIHLFVYLAVNALLIAVNFVATPDAVWFFWPLIGWGVGLAFHAWRVYREVLRRTVEHYALEQRLIGEIAEERRAEAQAAAAAAATPRDTPGDEAAGRRHAKNRAAAKGKAGAAKKSGAPGRKKPPAKKGEGGKKSAARKPAPRGRKAG